MISLHLLKVGLWSGSIAELSWATINSRTFDVFYRALFALCLVPTTCGPCFWSNNSKGHVKSHNLDISDISWAIFLILCLLHICWAISARIAYFWKIRKASFKLPSEGCVQKAFTGYYLIPISEIVMKVRKYLVHHICLENFVDIGHDKSNKRWYDADFLCVGSGQVQCTRGKKNHVHDFNTHENFVELSRWWYLCARL